MCPVFCDNIRDGLLNVIHDIPFDKLFVLLDEQTEKLCFPLLKLEEAQIIRIKSGESNKNIATVGHVWQQLSALGASRHSLLVNVGGGMLTDLGGFAAATFKRGIRYVNVPTTLLAMVDASVGGKTGINLDGLKNEIGAFCPAEQVVVCTRFLLTLDKRNCLSGYAEMIKHGLLSNTAHWAELMSFDWQKPDLSLLQDMAMRSVLIKQLIVEKDPYESGTRKALNFGHTVGHALESFSRHRAEPLLHGTAVAFGMVCELYLSFMKLGFPKDKLRQTVQYIKDNYSAFAFDCKHYDELYELMTHDKKNVADTICFTLLSQIGDFRINQQVTHDEIFEALDFYRESLGA
ncbi:MAG: 3-dehydroquinate synthase [Bacteroidales bacterium]|nr:3-dehydroquinate synthase [Bacteroidales bacterium]